MTSTGDPAERLAVLFDAHYGRLYRLARRLVSRREDALDLVQETFLRAARSPATIPTGSSNEEAWFVRILVNIRRDQWRHAAVQDRFYIDAKGGRNESESCSQSPEPAIVARSTLWKALELLPPRRRAVIVMHELEGLDIISIASLLGISSITVRWHLSKGRRELACAIKHDDTQSIGGTR
jgi:RNA polymerase sigma factor (sigma-70 family)